MKYQKRYRTASCFIKQSEAELREEREKEGVLTGIIKRQQQRPGSKALPELV